MAEVIFVALSASLSRQLLELVKQSAAGPDQDLLLKEIASRIERGLPHDDADPEHGLHLIDLCAAGDALLLAAQYNCSTAALDRILRRPECSALLHHTNAKSESLLHIAAKAGHLDVVEVLLRIARDAGEVQTKRLVQMRSRGGNAALHEAVRSKSPVVVERIAEKGKEMISAANDEGRSPLYIAVEMGFVQGVRTMLDKDPAAYWQTGPGGRSLLHAAVSSHNLGEI